MLILSLVGIILTMANAISQQQAGVHDWNIRLFGKLKSVQVAEQKIYYQNTEGQNGIIVKATGQVSQRNSHVMCDSYNYVNYEPHQQIIQLFNDGYSTLAEKRLDRQIDQCLIGLNGEKIIIYGQLIFSTNNFTTNVQEKIIYAGYIFDIPVVILQKENEICVNKITGEVNQSYCAQTSQNGKVYEFGKTLIYIDEHFAYNLKENQAKQLDINLMKKAKQFLGFSQTIVVQNERNLTITSLEGNLELTLSSHEFVVENLETQKYYFIIGQKDQILSITTFDRDTQTKTSVSIETSTRFAVLQAFLIDLSKRQFLVQYTDLQSIMVDKHVIWTTEQSLISIDAIFYQKYENEDKTHKNTYYESLEKHGSNNALFLFQNLISRVLNEISDLKEALIHYSSTLGSEKLKTNEMEQTYGLKQKIYFLTSFGTLLCFDSQEQALLQKLTVNQDESFKLISHQQIEQRLILISSNLIRNFGEDDAQPAHILFYYSESKQRLNTFILDLQHGMIQQVASQLSKNIIWVLPYRVEGGPGVHNNIIILIDEEENIITYPRYENLQTKEILLFKNDNGVLQGYKLQGTKLETIWVINIKDKILKIRSSYHGGEENPRVAIWDDKKVIFKLIDHSNFALLTSDEDKLKLYIINGKTGKIIFQSVQSEADFEQPINLVFDEHQIFVTYYNKMQMMYEIWTVEIYHAKIEVSFIKMLENYYFTQTPIVTNYYKADFEAFFLQQVYGYPLGIKHLSVSKSLKQLTKKNLLIITSSGQVHSLDRNLVSTRRREKADQPILEYSLQSAELPPYQYQLPVVYQNMLTYYQSFDVEKFSIEPTNLESSALLLVYGTDLFFTRIAPDKMYDMLQEDFSYRSLMATIVLVIVAIVVLSRMTKQKLKLKQFYVN